jgi:ABC-type amino acid transport substrate-binding protein/Ca2+-binding RTX toxin-like protein
LGITGTLDLALEPTKKQITFNGNVDLAQIIKGVADNKSLPIPSLSLTKPTLTYTTGTNQTVYTLKAGDLEVNYTKDTKSFNAKGLPVGDLTDWLEEQLGSSDLGIDGTVNIAVKPEDQEIGFNGNVDISQIIKAIAGYPSLPIPSLNLENPVITYRSANNQTVYNLKAGELEVNYTKNANGTYNFAAKGLPVGEMSDWLEEQLGSSDLGITGKVNIATEPNSTQIAFKGNVDISQMVKALAGNSNLPIPSLKLDDPALTYKVLDGQTQYKFTSTTLAIDYTKNTDNTYTFAVDKLPIDSLKGWLKAELGINDLGIPGNIDIDVTSSSKQITFNGNVDLSKVVKSITGLSLPSLDVATPSLNYTVNSQATQYSFTSTSGLGFTYTKDPQGQTTFAAKNLPIGTFSTWLGNELGLSNLSNVVTGTVDLLQSPQEKQLSLKGNVSITNLAKLINLSVPSDLTNLTINNPSITVTGTGTNRGYELSGTGQVTLSKDTFGDFTEVAQLLPGITATTTGITLSGELEVTKSASGVLSLQGVLPALGAIKLNRENNKWKLAAIEDGDRLTLSDLAIIATDDEYKFTDIFSYQFKGDANLGIKTKTSVDGDPAFPSFSLDVAANLPLFNYGDQAQATNKGLDISVKNVTLDAGTFITDFTRPVVGVVDTIFDPVKPIIKSLNADTKLFSYIGLESAFNYDKKDGVSLLDIAGTLGTSPLLKAKNPNIAEKIQTAYKFSQTISNIVDLVDTLNDTPEDQSFTINFGNFNLNNFKAASKDKADSASTAPVPVSSSPSPSYTVPTTTTGSSTPSTPAGSTSASSKPPAGNFFTKAINKLKSIEGLSIPLLTDPKNAFKLVLGQTVDLVKYDIPDLEFGFDFEQEFPIYSPPTIKGLLGASFNAKTDFAVGFDTYGFNQWKAADFNIEDAYKVLDGFYLDDLSKDGKTDKEEMSINAQITAGLALDILVAEARLKGGLEGHIGFDLEDIGEKNGTSDGKVRGSEIVSRLNRPLSLFELTGTLDAFLRGEVRIGSSTLGIYTTVWEQEFARFRLAEFKLDESGFSGSIGGKVSNSYIADSLVYLDANLNNQLDENEPLTKTNSTGEFDLKFDLTQFDTNENGKLDDNEGQIIAFGGIDSSTGVPLATQLITGVDSAMITPLTNLENFLVKEGYVDSLEAAEKLIAKRLGLSLKPLDVDLENFDPLDALSSALVAEQEMGVDIYLAHVKVQNLMIHADAFLKGLEPNLSPEDIQQQTTAVLAEIFTSESGIFDLDDPQELQTFFNQLADQVQNGVQSRDGGNSSQASPEVIALVAEVLADSNQTIDDLAASASDRTVELVMQTVAPMKRAVQGEMAVTTNNLTSGELTLEEAQQQYQEQSDSSQFLVEQTLSDERTIKIYAVGDLAENSKNQGEIIIELGEAAPNQGLNLLYSLSGTATLSEDYQFSGGSIGQLYIEPGATQVKLNITALDDRLSEGPETITLNLRYVGEGFQFDPEYQTAVMTLTDDERQSTLDTTRDPLVTGTVGNDKFEGTDENDNYNGNYGDDLIVGKGGSDRLQGNYGDDTLEGGNGADILQGNYGKDQLQGNDGDDLLEGGDDADTLVGGSGKDQLNGQTGDDFLEGGKGNDLLEGGEGNDRLEGNEDNDWLLGDGADRFVIALDSGIDTLLDFDPLEGDKIVIDGSSFNIENLENFQFIGGYLYYQEQQIAAVQNEGKIYNTFSDLSQVLELVENVDDIEVPETAALSVASTATSSLQKSQPQRRDGEPQSAPSNFLEEVLQRGYVKVGIIPDRPGFAEEINGELQGYSITWGRALAAALFGDASKVEFVPQDGTSETIGNVGSRQIDVATTDTTVLLYRDASLNIDYSPVHLYGTRAIMVKGDSGIDGAKDLEGLTIGVTNTFGWENLQNFMQQEGIEIKGKLFESTAEMYAAYERGEIDAVTGDRTRLLTAIPTLAEPKNHRILDEEISQEPIAMVLPENESEWADVVRWITYAPMQAEEYGISSSNIDQFIANSTDPSIRRFLGLEGTNGEALGISNDFVVNTIKAVGNYGEIYEENFSGLPRNRNDLWFNDGLIYSPPFAGGVSSSTPLIDNDARNLLAEILQRGSVKVGVAGNSPGFALQANGEWAGLDVDLGKALSAALFSNPNQVEFVTQSFSDGFPNVANGVVDVSAMGITQNLVRDASLGIDYSKPYFYTGAGILVRADSGITSLPMLNGHKVGVVAGRTSQQNLEDALTRVGANLVPVLFTKNSDLFAAYDKGELDALVTDLPIISSYIPTLSDPENHRLLDEVLSKDPLALAIDENQSDWADVVNWVLRTLVEAEKLGITQSNVDELIAFSTDPAVRRLLGVEDNLGGALGLPKDFAAQMIKAVGNYSEIYNRNFDANVLPRDSNELFENFGLQYAESFGSTPESVIEPPSDSDTETPSTPGETPLNPGETTALSPTANSSSNSSSSSTDSQTSTDTSKTIDLNILGTQSAMGNISPDQIMGNKQDNLILTLDGDDTILGADGNDTLIANQGNDVLEGGNGNDFLYGGQGDDLQDGQGGEDTVFGDKGNDTLTGGINNDWLNGNVGDDIVNGDAGDDILYGGQNNDKVFGGVGNDTLFGYKGNDTLTGGEGSDRFFLIAGNGSDVISDFQDGQDLLLLDQALTFEQLTITAEGNATIIELDSQILMRLQGVNGVLITQDDFANLF